MKVLVLGGLLALCCNALSQGYKGADYALAKAGEKPEPPKHAQPEDLLRAAISSYAEAAPALSDTQKASRWLSLVDRFLEIPRAFPGTPDNRAYLVFQDVMRVMPGPAVWPLIRDSFRARSRSKGAAQDWALLSLFDLLCGDSRAVRSDLALVQSHSPDSATYLAPAYQKLALRNNDPDQLKAAIRTRILVQNRPGRSLSGREGFDLPNLIAILGRDQARQLLEEALTSLKVEVVFRPGDPTADLACQVALAQVDHLPAAQWSLADTSNGAELFAALSKKFPEDHWGIERSMLGALSSYSAAATRYVAYLALVGQTEAAKDLIAKADSLVRLGPVPDDAVDTIIAGGKAENLVTLLEFAVRKGHMGLYDYVATAERTGYSDRAKQFVASGGAFEPAQRADASDEKLRGLLRDGKHDDAISVLRAALKAEEGKQQLRNRWPNYGSQLTQVGKTLSRSELIDEGLTAGIQAFSASEDTFGVDWVIQSLIERGRGLEAEKLILQALQRQLHSQGSSTPPSGAHELDLLAVLYSAVGRDEDVLALLTDAPYWGHPDLAFLQDSNKGEKNLVYIGAKALAKTGRTEQALKVVMFLLQCNRDFDPGYELLLAVAPDKSGEVLDRLHTADPYQPRPLMWKAELLRRQGRFAVAEQLVRKAISLDPQDTGSEPRARRHQAWFILADIEEAEGKTKEANLDRAKFNGGALEKVANDDDQANLSSHSLEARLKYLEVNPEDFAVRFLVFDALMKLNRTEEGLQHLQIGIQSAVRERGVSSIDVFNNAEWDWPIARKTAVSTLLELVSKTPTSNAYAILGDFYLETDDP